MGNNPLCSCGIR